MNVRSRPEWCRRAETKVFEQKKDRRFSLQEDEEKITGTREDVSMDDHYGAPTPPAAETEHRDGGLARADLRHEGKANAVDVASVALVANPGDDISSHDERFCGFDGKSFSNGCLSSEV